MDICIGCEPPDRGVLKPILVSYTVQKGGTLWKLWQKSEMERQEWMSLNNGRDPDKFLHAGETIVLKDPLASCLDAAGVTRFVDYPIQRHNCEVRYGAFKPLEGLYK
ncbi:MAG: LysM peptidoglycan-binding domain-containing protein [Deltaproteobacteria bacterium]|nr:LysM peptidoglycan-binding domain-containing protein [Deltaproteobacteria bacterium]